MTHLRERFPILERLTYLDSCSQGALSTDVREAYERYLRDWDELGSPWELWVEKADEARDAFASLIAAAPDEVAVTTSLSAAVSALASGLSFDKRDKVVLSDVEFPTVGQIWHAQEARGAHVVHTREFEREIDERTLLVSLTHVGYRTGERLPVEDVVPLARERGALVLLDAYQSAGTVPLDVRALDVDFLSAGTVKYLLGSAGLAFLYANRRAVASIRPTATGWFADEDVFAMDDRDYSPAPTAARFQSGTPPVPSLYAGVAGMSLVADAGVDRTSEHVAGLTERIVAGVRELGGVVATPERRGALVCVASTDAERLVGALREDGIVTSPRASNVRISTHFYNSDEDVDAALGSLGRNRGLLRRSR